MKPAQVKSRPSSGSVDQDLDLYVAFVRAVMVGRGGLTREVLLEAFRTSGAEEPISHLATGNVSFHAQRERVTCLAREAEGAIGAVIGRPTPVFVRSLEALQSSVTNSPFASAPIPDPHERCVSFCDCDLTWLELPITTTRGDALTFAATPGGAYSVTRVIDGRAGNPGKTLEALLHAPVTTRNWNTVERIVARLC